jgi:hypothetical protein
MFMSNIDIRSLVTGANDAVYEGGEKLLSSGSAMDNSANALGADLISAFNSHASNMADKLVTYADTVAKNFGAISSPTSDAQQKVTTDLLSVMSAVGSALGSTAPSFAEGIFSQVNAAMGSAGQTVPSAFLAAASGASTGTSATGTQSAGLDVSEQNAVINIMSLITNSQNASAAAIGSNFLASNSQYGTNTIIGADIQNIVSTINGKGNVGSAMALLAKDVTSPSMTSTTSTLTVVVGGQSMSVAPNIRTLISNAQEEYSKKQWSSVQATAESIMMQSTPSSPLFQSALNLMNSMSGKDKNSKPKMDDLYKYGFGDGSTPK